MSLIYCPECGHEISNSAVACPNCGRPINQVPIVERKVVPMPPIERDRGFPAWAVAVLGIMGAVVLFLLIAYWSQNREDEANTSVRLNANMPQRQQPINNRQIAESAPSNVPGATTPPPAETTVSGSQVSIPQTPTKGTAVLQAKVVTRNSAQQPVRNQRFYLLDKDVESILSEARIEPIEGQTLTDSLGLAAMYPDRYSDFQQRALRAIKNHVKYAGTTDANGKAQLGNIQPDSYYVFGVAKAGNGYAIWSSPVTIQPGENDLNLTPQPITEINTNNGE